MDENDLSNAVIGAAIEVHRQLGPGLLESVYRKCLEYELKERGIDTECELILPVRYKTLKLEAGYRADMIVEGRVIVELKAAEALLPIFTAQLLSYLRMSGLKLGLLINFNVSRLADGVRRVANQL